MMTNDAYASEELAGIFCPAEDNFVSIDKIEPEKAAKSPLMVFTYLLPLIGEEAVEYEKKKENYDKPDFVCVEFENIFDLSKMKMRHNEHIIGEKTLLIAPRQEAWRIEAYRLFHRTFSQRAWSDPAFCFDRALRGISENSIAERLRQLKQVMAGWNCITVYLLLPRPFFDKLVNFDRKAFHARLPAKAVVFRPLQRDRVNPKSRQLQQFLEPTAQFVLARAGFRWPFIQNHTGPVEGDIQFYRFRKATLPLLNSSLKTRIQIFQQSCWQV